METNKLIVACAVSGDGVDNLLAVHKLADGTAQNEDKADYDQSVTVVDVD